MKSTTRVKICCIQDVDEALLAIAAGTSALGLVSTMPSGPGVISEADIARIVPTVPDHIGTFLLTSRTAPDEIIAQQARTGVDTLQLCDRMDESDLVELRRALPSVTIVQVVHVVNAASVDEAVFLGSRVDALLLDSGDPEREVKELGGTGRVHDWSLSRRIVESVSVPVYLAGGLRPDNVVAAIRSVGPFGVDVCSGLRPAGRLDRQSLEDFMGAVDGA